MEENYYETELEQEVDNFHPQTVIDYVLGFVVCLTILTCVILNAIHLKELIFEKRVEEKIRKKENEEHKS